MMPATADTRLDDIGREFVSTVNQLVQLGRGCHASTGCWQAMTEHIGDQSQFGISADWARQAGRCTHVAGGANEFGMGIANLVLAKPTATKLVDQMASCQTMVDNRCRAAQRVERERHSASLPTGRESPIAASQPATLVS